MTMLGVFSVVCREGRTIAFHLYDMGISAVCCKQRLEFAFRIVQHCLNRHDRRNLCPYGGVELTQFAWARLGRVANQGPFLAMLRRGTPFAPIRRVARRWV